MSYYWFHRDKILKNARDKYNNKGGKKKVAKYYKDNMEVLREDAKNKFRNLSEKEKKKRKYQRNRYTFMLEDQKEKRCDVAVNVDNVAVIL